jgi:hypothetical protein
LSHESALKQAQNHFATHDRIAVHHELAIAVSL